MFLSYLREPGGRVITRMRRARVERVVGVFKVLYYG